MTQKQRMENGELYAPGDSEIFREQLQCLDLLSDFNQTKPSELAKRKVMMKQMFAEVGDGCYFELPIHANWGGKHVHLGREIYANFNLTLVDDGDIYIGDWTLIGPNVTIATAGHPILPELRENRIYQYNMPVHIGRCCWLGAGVIVLPGVTIGDNCVIGAGSVVTKNVPANSVAVGNPCRVLRQINDHDREFYFKDRKIDWDSIRND